MLAECIRRWMIDVYRAKLFALMHDDNHSARISDRYGRVIRRYTLYARDLRR